MSEVARLMAELNSSHESAVNADKSRVLLTKQVAELQSKLDEAETAGRRTVWNHVANLENRILELESDLDSEARKSAEIVKLARKADKRVKEMEFELEDERKANLQLQEASEKLNSKLKSMRLQMEEMEQQVSAWRSKYKKAAAELEESEDRCEAVENALRKARQKLRGASQATSRVITKMW